MGLFNILSRKKSLPASTLAKEGQTLFYTADDLIRLVGQNYNGRIATDTVEGQSCAFNRASIVDAILFEKVSAIRDARFWLNNDRGEEVDNPVELERLTTPNGYESFKEFVAKVEFFSQLYGKCYIAKIKPLGFRGEVELHVLPNPLVVENTTTTGVATFAPRSNILDYTVKLDKNYQITLQPGEVEVISDVSYSLSGFYAGASRLVSLEEQINNFITVQQATNELLVNRGMLGIITMKSGGPDAMVAQRLPATEKDKEELQRALSKYGITRGKAKYAMTSYDANYVPISSSIADLGIEGVRADSRADICNVYQVPTVLFDVSGSTYSNYGEAKKKMIEGDIQPAAQNIANTIMRIREEKKLRMTATFDHLDIFQNAKRAQAAGLASLIQAMRSGVEAGLVDAEQAKQTIQKYLTE